MALERRWKVLCAYCGSNAVQETMENGSGANAEASPVGVLDDIWSLPSTRLQARVMRSPSLLEVGQQALLWQPDIIFLSGPQNPTSHLLGELAWRAEDADGQPLDFASVFQGLAVKTIFLNAVNASPLVQSLHTAGIENVIHWSSQSVSSDLATIFARNFFATLRDPLANPLEAYACAQQIVQAYCKENGNFSQSENASWPLLSSEIEAKLPDMTSIPAPDIQGATMTEKGVIGIDSWEDLRLLAPHAEIKLSLCGKTELFEQKRQGAFGTALRALLVREMRSSVLLGFEKSSKNPTHLNAGSTALKCNVQTGNNVSLDAVLAGPEPAISNMATIQLALRHTFTADSLSLQMRLPAIGGPIPKSSTSGKIAFGYSCIEVTAITSVWTVRVLTGLAQDPSYRGLASLGIAAVGGKPLQAFTIQDAKQFSSLSLQSSSLGQMIPKQYFPGQTNFPISLGKPPQSPIHNPHLGHPPQIGSPSGLMGQNLGHTLGNRVSQGNLLQSPQRNLDQSPGRNLDYSSGRSLLESPGRQAYRASPGKSPRNRLLKSEAGDGAYLDEDYDEEFGSKKKRKRHKARHEQDPNYGSAFQHQVPGAKGLEIPYISNRRPIQICSEQEWLEDYCKFTSSQMGKHLTPENWPDTVLNGEALDVFHLYKEVVTRGGFLMGNGINWKGQIFPTMRNFSQGHKMTGIGNTLKTKYQQFLLDYERAHPEDVTTDRCVVCGGGEEVATDWVSCDNCNSWVHFSCDRRAGLGTFKEYAKTDGLSYTCSICASQHA